MDSTNVNRLFLAVLSFAYSCSSCKIPHENFNMTVCCVFLAWQDFPTDSGENIILKGEKEAQFYELSFAFLWVRDRCF